MGYENWLREVDNILFNSVGVTSGDMRDRLWRDTYECGDSPADAIFELCGDVDDIEQFMEDELFG
jgi:hypothetical protein